MSLLQAVLLALVLLVASIAYILWPTEQKLEVSPEVLSRLSQLRSERKFIDQYGIIRPEERERLEPLINELLDRLIVGLPMNPRKSCAMAEMKRTVSRFYLEDTELREPSVGYVEQVIAILGIKSTDRAFWRYMIFI